MSGLDRAGYQSKFEVMEEITDQVFGLTEDLYQSGFDTVHEATLKGLQKAADLTGQYGMTYLAELLREITEEISAGRHRMEKQTGRMAELYTKISEYLSLCRQKTAYDRGFNYYNQ